MKAQIELIDLNSKEIINVEDIDDKNTLMYKDSDNAFCVLNVLDNGLKISRNAEDHNTFVFLTKELSYIEVETSEGKLKFDAKVLEIKNINDIITLVYNIDGENKIINIKYIGV